MSELEVKNLSKRYGPDLVLDDVSFTVAHGELVTVLGQSGSGKTTILRSIAGFIEPSGGDVVAGGRSIIRLPINKRGIGIVFQNYALFPHMTVRQNVAYGLKVRRVPKAEMIERVDRELDRVMLTPYADRKPAQLSGGQQQRVAVARALVLEPSIVLFDEPFSNLDAMLRDDLRRELRQLQQRLGFTALFVTHDQREAMTLADHVAVMRAGKLTQFGTPAEVYERPARAEVAELLGRANLITASTDGASGALSWSGHRLRSADPVPAGVSQVSLMVRPEHVLIEAGAAAGGDRAGVGNGVENTMLGTVLSAEYQGAGHLVSVDIGGDGATTPVLAETRAGLGVVSFEVGSAVTVRIPAEAIRILG